MKLSSVRLSVRPSHHSAATRRCGGFAAVCPAATRYRPIAARPALSSKGERCRVVNSTQLNSTQLNTELRTQVSDTSKSAS